MPVPYYANAHIDETRYVSDKKNWTVGDFISGWENMPEGSTINGSVNSENIYYDIMRNNAETFVDYKNATVDSDCPEFRKILEFCNRFESNNSQKGEYYYEQPRMITYINLSNINFTKLFGEHNNDILQFTTTLSYRVE